MSENQNRQPQGLPVGGQFATTTRTESSVALLSPVDRTEQAIAAWTSTKVPGRDEVMRILEDLRAYTRDAGVSDEAFAQMVTQATR